MRRYLRGYLRLNTEFPYPGIPAFHSLHFEITHSPDENNIWTSSLSTTPSSSPPTMTTTRRPSPSPSSVPTSNSGKLPKFFQKQSRDQARTIPSPTSDASTTSNTSRQYRKSSKLLVFGRDAQTNSSTTSTGASTPNISD